MATAVALLAGACGSGSPLTAVVTEPTSQAETTATETPATPVESTGSVLTADTAPNCDSESAGGVALQSAQALVDRLIDGAENGDFKPAADLWTGIYAAPDSQLFLKDLVAENSWLLAGKPTLVAVDAYSNQTFCPDQVVAVTDTDRRGTFAILVDLNGTIQRIQDVHELPESPEITSSRVVVPIAPVEGGAIAYLESTRLPDAAVAVDPNQASTAITLPTPGDGPRLLIVSMATPELPTAHSFLVPS